MAHATSSFLSFFDVQGLKRKDQFSDSGFILSLNFVLHFVALLCTVPGWVIVFKVLILAELPRWHVTIVLLHILRILFPSIRERLSCSDIKVTPCASYRSKEWS